VVEAEVGEEEVVGSKLACACSPHWKGERREEEEEEERADMRSRKRGGVWRGGTILGVRCRFYKKKKHMYIYLFNYINVLHE
jgi:hypothetical protein